MPPIQIRKDIMQTKRLTREDIIATYNEVLMTCGLMPKDLWLSSGAALVMHGLREDAGDIDSGCHLVTLNIISSALNVVPVPFPAGHEYIKEGRLNLILPDRRMDVLHEERITQLDVMQIDGVTVYTPLMLLCQKMALDRPKDQDDLVKLKKLVYCGER